jgi:hypothetical protein
MIALDASQRSSTAGDTSLAHSVTWASIVLIVVQKNANSCGQHHWRARFAEFCESFDCLALPLLYRAGE